MNKKGRRLYTRPNPPFLVGLPIYIIGSLLLLFMLFNTAQTAYHIWKNQILTVGAIILIIIVICFFILTVFLVPFFSSIEIYENGIYIPKLYKSLPHRIKYKEKYPFYYFDDIIDFHEKPLRLGPGFYFETQGKKILFLVGNANRKTFELIKEVYNEYKNKKSEKPQI